MAAATLVKVNSRQAWRVAEATGKLRQIERQIIAIEKEIMLLIKTDPDLAGRFDILVSIPRVSALTAFVLLICRTRHTPSEPSGLARRSGTRHTAVRSMERSCLHPWRTCKCLACPIHGGTPRHALQSRSQSKIPPAKSRRKSTQGCHHAKAHRLQTRYSRNAENGWHPCLDQHEYSRSHTHKIVLDLSDL